jgi:hypothetical protein
MNPYEHPRGEPELNLRLRNDAASWSHYEVDFRAAFPTRHDRNHTARGDYLQPHGVQGAPLVILLHGVGDHSVIPCRWLAHRLARRGIACFLLYLVVHSSRMPDGLRGRMPTVSDDEWFEWYQTSVIEVRQLVDWAAARPEIDETRVGVLGISFGGFVASIAMAVDERIGGGAFIVSGGDSVEIVQKARLGAIRRGYRMSPAEYAEGRRAYDAYLADVEERGVDSVEPPRRSYLNDPMTFAHLLRGRPVQMVNARWDEFVPREATLGFWQACGCPAISWYPTNHTAIWLWYPSIRRRIEAFFGATFG